MPTTPTQPPRIWKPNDIFVDKSICYLSNTYVAVSLYKKWKIADFKIIVDREEHIWLPHPYD